MNRNTAHLVVIALAVIAVVVSLGLYQQNRRSSGIEIGFGGRSISIEKR